MKTALLIAVVIAVAVVIIAMRRKCGCGSNCRCGTEGHAVSAGKPVQLQLAMRQLWYDHVARTRLYIISALSGLPDQHVALQHLMANQDDIGNAIVLYYGRAAGKKLTALLKEHIAIGGKIIAAVGQNADVAALAAQWQSNADQIAAFLSAANQAWPLADMKSMMRDHLALTTAEVLARAQSRYADDIAAYDKVVTQAARMADMLSSGIITQFHLV